MFSTVKTIAHRVRNIRTLKNKYDLTLCQSHLHTAAKTFVCIRSVLVLLHVLVFMSFILKFSYGSCLVHASLAIVSLCHWFPCSRCHVFIGYFLVMRLSVLSAHWLVLVMCPVLLL